MFTVAQLRRRGDKRQDGRVRLLQPAKRKGVGFAQSKRRNQQRGDAATPANEPARGVNHAAAKGKATHPARCGDEGRADKEVQFAD